MTNINCHYAEHREEERELPKCRKTYGYPPSMRHGSTTHTHIAYDVSLLPQDCYKWLSQRMDVNCKVNVFFYPESNSFPWSLRSAAQSSDRQFFSNQVWRGKSKVHSSYDLIQSKHWTYWLYIQTRGQCCVVGAIQQMFFTGRPKIFTLSDPFINQPEDSLW